MVEDAPRSHSDVAVILPQIDLQIRMEILQQELPEPGARHQVGVAHWEHLGKLKGNAPVATPFVQCPPFLGVSTLNNVKQRKRCRFVRGALGVHQVNGGSFTMPDSKVCRLR